MSSDTPIDDRALDSLSVAPPQTEGDSERKTGQDDAGRDASIDHRLKQDPEDSDARLDAGLDESMDASDPPSSTQPIHNSGPAPSSGYDEAAENARKD